MGRKGVTIDANTVLSITTTRTVSLVDALAEIMKNAAVLEEQVTYEVK
jgi:hypothetical protein